MTTTTIALRARSSKTVATRARVREAMKHTLAFLPVAPTSVRVTFTDENGPRGGVAIHCALEIRLPRRPAVHVASLATTPRLAFDAALAKLERALVRARQAELDAKRRPKKYFVARRALAAG